MENERLPKKAIFSTVPKETLVETLRLWKQSGTTGVRLHTAKMPVKSIIELIERCNEVGLHTMVDLPGVKVRTKDTPKMMKVDTSPGEVGNKYLPLIEGEEFTLVSITCKDELIQKRFDPQTNKCLRASFIPTQLEVGDTVTFSDGEIICEVVGVLQIDGYSCLRLQVKELSGKKEVYWNMGMGSPKDLFSGYVNPITESDELILKAIQEAGIQNDVTEIAVSFVSIPDHLDRTSAMLEQYGFDFENTSIVAKIETIEAVKNIERIVEKINQLASKGVNVIIEIGRGDLGDDCRAKGVDLSTQQAIILEAAKRSEVPVIIATNVAGSALKRLREKAEFEELTPEERGQIIQEILYDEVLAWMLAAETMHTGDKAPDVISAVRRAINQGVTFYNDYYRPWK